mgnify:FL=1
MSSTCPECGHLEDASNFCTQCGVRLHTLPAVAIASTSAPVASDTPAPPALAQGLPLGPVGESGWSKAGRVVDGVATGFTILIGIGWLIVGIVLLGFAFTGKAPILFLFGPLCIVYAIYLFKPGGWKLIIY